MKHLLPFLIVVCGIGRKHILRVKIPYKVSCFTWPGSERICSNPGQYEEKGYIICPRCYFYGQEAETISHPFLYCKVTTHLRDLLSTSGVLDGQCQDEQMSFCHVGMMKGENYYQQSQTEYCPSSILMDCVEG